jgi:tRNA-specific 2-thiouridylase
MHTLDFEKQYQQTVMKYFFAAYKKGLTPNPDVMCNKEIKFKLLYDWAMKNGFDYLATGHYARTAVSNQQSAISYKLLRSVDEFKDQTYFIYNIQTEQLPHILFPIGGMKKTAVRSLARKLKLPNAEKRESMGLCFVGKIRLKDFLEQKLTPKPGPITLLPAEVSLRVQPKQSLKNKGIATSSGQSPRLLAMGGTIIGQHQGLYNYTIGQRQGIAVGGGGPYYVVRKDLKTNTLFVTNDPEDKNLMVKEVQLHSVNWISLAYKLPAISCKLTGRYRHQGKLVSLKIVQVDKSHYQVTFSKPQKAVASGQSLVLYKGKECVGGGIIL